MIYTKIEKDGGWYVCPPSEVQEFLKSELESAPLEIGESISISAVEMSEEDFAALPEFDGF